MRHFLFRTDDAPGDQEITCEEIDMANLEAERKVSFLRPDGGDVAAVLHGINYLYDKDTGDVLYS